LDISEHDISNHISPETDLIDKESESIIFNFIETLDIELKTAFTLRELEGRSYEEISTIMKCPIGTVRSRIFRARQLILEFMNQENIIND
jgi:RNA polymerase sigma-70 factor (ECF subfamily)